MRRSVLSLVLCGLLLSGCRAAAPSAPAPPPPPAAPAPASPPAATAPAAVDADLSGVDDLVRQLDDEVGRADQAPADAD